MEYKILNKIRIDNPLVILKETNATPSFIFYAYGNILVKYDIIQNKRYIQQYGRYEITHLIESCKHSSSSFYIINKNNEIYKYNINNNQQKERVEVAYHLNQLTNCRIINIESLIEDRLLIHYQNEDNISKCYCIYDLNTNNIIYSKSNINKIIVIKSKHEYNLIEFNNNHVYLVKFNKEEREYRTNKKIEILDGIYDVNSSCNSESGIVFIIHQDQSKMTLWNINDNSSSIVSIDQSFKSIKSYNKSFSLFNIEKGWNHLADRDCNNENIQSILLSNEYLVLTGTNQPNELQIISLDDKDIDNRIIFDNLMESEILSMNQIGESLLLLVECQGSLLILRPNNRININIDNDFLSQIKLSTKQYDQIKTRKIITNIFKNNTNVDSEQLYEIFTVLKESSLKSESRLFSLLCGELTNDNKYLSVFKNQKCKSRLIVGDGDFSFTMALINKHKSTHPSLANSLTTSDLSMAPLQSEKIQQMENPIVRASFRANYRLIRKRRFDNTRYPGYIHLFTGLYLEHPQILKYEFVFEKLDNIVKGINNYTLDPKEISEQAAKLQDTNKKEYQVIQESTEITLTRTKQHVLKFNDNYFECSSDEDSSDYFESDGDDNDDDDDQFFN
ncbi:hypothetical protein PPL_07722 [Heterostelium album PN500]|uniref:Uncharacterized protein n=1 Tax=Heterostelium pallidum (strain ATCC 26659 / Pp 5 / PN500) TaxID=670386 RepID=D3BGS0_HETP5|nr:hypothetical protein PPL_07722 [Heterostelium album PN500]EFA79304.1 hypothetical protein PPL_07722 [Heterostelium album PN500]|eukprot:XP_020431425.1 hypothetical protein PPL_07722 [Heterostelium album PN500]